MWGPHDWSLQINNNIEHQAMYSASALQKKTTEFTKIAKIFFPWHWTSKIYLNVVKESPQLLTVF